MSLFLELTNTVLLTKTIELTSNQMAASTPELDDVSKVAKIMHLIESMMQHDVTYSSNASDLVRANDKLKRDYCFILDVITKIEAKKAFLANEMMIMHNKYAEKQREEERKRLGLSQVQIEQIRTQLKRRLWSTKNPNEIKKLRRSLLQKYHPDKIHQIKTHDLEAIGVFDVNTETDREFLLIVLNATTKIITELFLL